MVGINLKTLRSRIDEAKLGRGLYKTHPEQSVSDLEVLVDQLERDQGGARAAESPGKDTGDSGRERRASKTESQK